MGYDDAKKLYKRGAKSRALRTGEQVAKEICSHCREGHVTFLRSAYSAGLNQYKR